MTFKGGGNQKQKGKTHQVFLVIIYIDQAMESWTMNLQKSKCKQFSKYSDTCKVNTK